MPDTAIITSSTDQFSTNIAARLEQILGQSEADTADLSVKSLLEMDAATDWSPGEPCPSCGGEIFSVMEAAEQQYERVEDDAGESHLEYVTYGDAIGPTLSYWCFECETTVRGIPIATLGVHPDKLIDILHAVSLNRSIDMHATEPPPQNVGDSHFQRPPPVPVNTTSPSTSTRTRLSTIR